MDRPMVMVEAVVVGRHQLWTGRVRFLFGSPFLAFT
jgi:hypothetical protein